MEELLNKFLTRCDEHAAEVARKQRELFDKDVDVVTEVVKTAILDHLNNSYVRNFQIDIRGSPEEVLDVFGKYPCDSQRFTSAVIAKLKKFFQTKTVYMDITYELVLRFQCQVYRIQ